MSLEYTWYVGDYNALYTTTYLPSGYKNVWTRTGSATVTARSDKVSTDTGRFEPGIYRVNPYKIYREWYVCDTDIESITYKGVENGWEYRYDITGRFPALAWYPVQKTHFPNGLSKDITSNVGYHDEYALQRAYSDVSNASIQLGEDIAEIRETIAMLKNPLQSAREFLLSSNHRKLGLLNKLIHYQKTGRWTGRTGVDAARAAADTWLEFRYGIIPTLKTGQALVELANDGLRKFLPEQIHTGRGKSTRHYERTIPAAGNFSFGNAQCIQSAYQIDEISCYGRVQYHVLNEPGNILDIVGASPKYWPELTWALTRASFVADWFVDISTWLGMIRSLFDPSVEILGNTVGIRVDRSVSVITKVFFGHLTVKPSDPEYNFVTARCNYYERRVDQNLPLTPIIKLDVNNLLHVVDSAALIVQPVLKALRR